MDVPHVTRAEQGLAPDRPVQLAHWRFPRDDYPLHRHDFTELVLVRAGCGHHLTDWGTVTISAGDMFVLRPGQSHGFVRSRDMQIVNCMFLPEWLQANAYDLVGTAGYHALFMLDPVQRQRQRRWNRLRLSTAQLDALGPLLQARGAADPAPIAAMASQVLALIVHLCRFCAPIDAREHPLLPLASTIARLERDYAQDWTLEAMAATAHLSCNQFLRRFRAAYGTTPMAYLNDIRLHRACEYLATSDDSITRIAMACGFSDSNYFARCFKRVTGLTPRGYRQQMQFSEPV